MPTLSKLNIDLSVCAFYSLLAISVSLYISVTDCLENQCMKIRTICRVGLSTVQGHILFSAIFLEWCVPVLKRTGLISRDKSGLFVPTNTSNEPTINHRSMRSAWLRGTGLQMFRSCKTIGRCCANTSSNLAPFLIAYIIDAMTQTEVNVPPAISKANLTLSKPCRTWPVFAFGVAGDASGVSFVEP